MSCHDSIQKNIKHRKNDCTNDQMEKIFTKYQINSRDVSIKLKINLNKYDLQTDYR